MNNKGFAISTILYGLMILFIFLFLSLLGILSQQKNNIEKLIENTNGARDIVNGNKEVNFNKCVTKYECSVKCTDDECNCDSYPDECPLN